MSEPTLSELVIRLMERHIEEFEAQLLGAEAEVAALRTAVATLESKLAEARGKGEK